MKGKTSFSVLSKSLPVCLVLQISINWDDELQYDVKGEGVNEEPQGVLTFDRRTGALYVNEPLDYEEKKVFKVGDLALEIFLSSSVCFAVSIRRVSGMIGESTFMRIAARRSLIPWPSLLLSYVPS